MKKQSRIKEFGGYRFDRYLFKSYLLILFVVVLLIIALNGFSFESKLYLKCNDVKCENPCFDNYLEDACPQEIRNIEYFDKGFEYGEKPTFFMRNFTYIILLSVFVVFIINHLIYNRGYFKSERFKKYKEGVKKDLEKIEND